jgi:hypothetical protein
MKPKTISAEEFDRMFDDGEDISAYLDFSSVRRPGLEPKRVNVDFPQHVVDRLDRLAKVRGVSRQALIKMWMVDRLNQEELLDNAA